MVVAAFVWKCSQNTLRFEHWSTPHYYRQWITSKTYVLTHTLEINGLMDLVPFYINHWFPLSALNLRALSLLEVVLSLRNFQVSILLSFSLPLFNFTLSSPALLNYSYLFSFFLHYSLNIYSKNNAYMQPTIQRAHENLYRRDLSGCPVEFVRTCSSECLHSVLIPLSKVM